MSNRDDILRLVLTFRCPWAQFAMGCARVQGMHRVRMATDKFILLTRDGTLATLTICSMLVILDFQQTATWC